MCKRCFDPDTDAKEGNVSHPYSPKAGLYSGVPFLGIGGATGNGMITVEALDAFSGHGLAMIKDAGFQGVSFDMEMTGDGEIVSAQERAFANCQKAGLHVMVTCSTLNRATGHPRRLSSAQPCPGRLATAGHDQPLGAVRGGKRRAQGGARRLVYPRWDSNP